MRLCQGQSGTVGDSQGTVESSRGQSGAVGGSRRQWEIVGGSRGGQRNMRILTGVKSVQE